MAPVVAQSMGAMSARYSWSVTVTVTAMAIKA